MMDTCKAESLDLRKSLKLTTICARDKAPMVETIKEEEKCLEKLWKLLLLTILKVEAFNRCLKEEVVKNSDKNILKVIGHFEKMLKENVEHIQVMKTLLTTIVQRID